MYSYHQDWRLSTWGRAPAARLPCWHLLKYDRSEEPLSKVVVQWQNRDIRTFGKFQNTLKTKSRGENPMRFPLTISAGSQAPQAWVQSNSIISHVLQLPSCCEFFFLFSWKLSKWKTMGFSLIWGSGNKRKVGSNQLFIQSNIFYSSLSLHYFWDLYTVHGDFLIPFRFWPDFSFHDG